MQNQFNKTPTWSEPQTQILNTAPNLLVHGSAGSGKTLLACHLAMKHSHNRSVALLVYTKSLKKFIRNYIDSFGENKVRVLHEYEWSNWDFENYDIVIVDEVQDLSKFDLESVKSRSKLGVYIFGDLEQSIYKRNSKNQVTVWVDDLNALEEKDNFKIIELYDNFRISEENRKFIKAIYPKLMGFKKESFKTGLKPKIQRFETIEEELNWLKDFLVSNTTFKNIGILLKENESYLGGYFYRKRIRKDKTYGVEDLQHFFEENGVQIDYKYKRQDNLDFSKEINANVMTYHSAKGLQFDCVILPFNNRASNNYGYHNLPYVGMTRASKQIIITYSGIVAREFEKLSHNIYDGKIVKKSIHDGPTNQQKLDMKRIYDYTYKTKHPMPADLRERAKKLDYSDCKIFGF